MAKTTKGSAEKPSSIDDLKPAPYNPRKIGAEALRALEKSLGSFGDISGIVWNRQTGNLVAGHQRLEALKKKYGAGLRLDEDDKGGPMLFTPDGLEFSVRVVDWPLTKEKAANAAANSPLLGGEFTSDLAQIIAEIEAESPDLVDELRLNELSEYIVEDEAEEADDEMPPEEPIEEMELQPFEHYDYCVILARNTQDWQWLVGKLQLGKVDSSPVPTVKKIGIGRAIDASKFIRLWEEERGVSLR